MKWYIVHTVSGQEKKTKEAIERAIEKEGLTEDFGEVLMPVETQTKKRSGKKITTERKVMPGYIFVQMNLTEGTWSAVKSVSRLLESNGKPKAISEAEVNNIVERAQDGTSSESQETYSVSEVVKITDGAFESFSGSIEEIDEEKKTVKVLVSIFGRATPVVLQFNQIEKEEA